MLRKDAPKSCSAPIMEPNCLARHFCKLSIIEIPSPKKAHIKAHLQDVQDFEVGIACPTQSQQRARYARGIERASSARNPEESRDDSTKLWKPREEGGLALPRRKKELLRKLFFPWDIVRSLNQSAPSSSSISTRSYSHLKSLGPAPCSSSRPGSRRASLGK